MRTILLRISMLVCALALLGCTAASAAQKNDLLSQAVKDQIIASDYEPENYRNVQIVVTGEATVLPFEKDRGVEKALCLNIQYEKKVATDQWVAGTNSRIIQQKGTDWIVNDALLAVERAWSQHSCLGTYLKIDVTE